MSTIWMDVDAALSEVPVNICPLVDSADGVTIDTGVAYNASGLVLVWHFVTPAGATTATQVTPTSGGTYDWAHQAQGMYSIEIPASGGASINNDTEGFGYFTGVATGVLPWRGPTIGFRAAALNDALIENAWSTTRGLAGLALPDVAAGAAGSVNDATRIGGTTQTGGDLYSYLTTNLGSLGANLSAIPKTGFKLANDGLAAVTAWTVDITGTITTATNLTNLPSIPAGWLTAAGIADGAFTAAKFASGAFDAVWTVATRILTAGTNIVLAKGVGVTGLNDLDAAGVRSAVGLATANLDTQLAAIPTAAENRVEMDSNSTKLANLDATVSSRASQTSVDGVPTTAEFEARTLSTGAVARLERSVNAIATGTVGTGSTTTNIVTSALSPAGAVADQFKGRIVTFDSATTTAALRGQATDITASSNAALAVLTVTALAATPASGDTFTIT